MFYREIHQRADGSLLEMTLDGHGRYRLRLGSPGNWVVSYEDGQRSVNGRREPYAFRSVEQMRYDFENDVRDARRPG